MIVRSVDSVALIDPNYTFKEKVNYITKFITRAFVIAVFIVLFIFFILGSIYFFDLNLKC